MFVETKYFGAERTAAPMASFWLHTGDGFPETAGPPVPLGEVDQQAEVHSVGKRCREAHRNPTTGWTLNKATCL